MASEETDIVVVSQFPDADCHVIRAGEEEVLIDGHAGDGVFVTAELGNVVVSADVPHVNLLVTTSND